jgi:hypothetical protein
MYGTSCIVHSDGAAWPTICWLPGRQCSMYVLLFVHELGYGVFAGGQCVMWPSWLQLL